MTTTIVGYRHLDTIRGLDIFIFSILFSPNYFDNSLLDQEIHVCLLLTILTLFSTVTVLSVFWGSLSGFSSLQRWWIFKVYIEGVAASDPWCLLFLAMAHTAHCRGGTFWVSNFCQCKWTISCNTEIVNRQILVMYLELSRYKQ